MTQPPTLEIVLRRVGGRAVSWRIDLELAGLIVVGAVSTALALRLALAPPIWL